MIAYFELALRKWRVTDCEVLRIGGVFNVTTVIYMKGYAVY